MPDPPSSLCAKNNTPNPPRCSFFGLPVGRGETARAVAGGRNDDDDEYDFDDDASNGGYYSGEAEGEDEDDEEEDPRDMMFEDGEGECFCAGCYQRYLNDRARRKRRARRDDPEAKAKRAEQRAAEAARRAAEEADRKLQREDPLASEAWRGGGEARVRCLKGGGKQEQQF